MSIVRFIREFDHFVTRNFIRVFHIGHELPADHPAAVAALASGHAVVVDQTPAAPVEEPAHEPDPGTEPDVA